MIKIDYNDGRSIYEQIEDGIKNLIVNKVIEADGQLPSVRELSVSLTVNPNTVQKAYKQLENGGFIYSVKGKGNFVAPVSYIRDSVKLGELYKTLGATVRALMYLGETDEMILAEIKRIKEEVL